MQNTPSSSKWTKCLSVDGKIRGVAIQAKQLIQETVKIHKVESTDARGLGEAFTAALLVASYCKKGERINLNIQGSGYYRQAVIDAYPDGKIRGYLLKRAPEIVPEEVKEGQKGPWGEGVLSVIRTKDGEGKQPFIGHVPLVTGHLAKDLTFYWAQSEQIPSAVGISVKMEQDQVVAAGGFLVQAMPQAKEEDIQSIEKEVTRFSKFADQVAEDANPTSLLSHLFQSRPFTLIEETDLEFHCQCDAQRVDRALALVGREELEKMLLEKGRATVRCDFCRKVYSVNSGRLKELIQSAREAQ